MKNCAKVFILNFLFAASLSAQSEEFGIASFYSDLFQGKPTASGELYDKSKLTCAHKTYAFGTVLRVTRLDNKKSVQVRVNDPGPFISGRVVELSREAASRIGLVSDGSARVKVEMVDKKTSEAVTAKPADTPKSYEEDTLAKTDVKKSPAPKDDAKSTASTDRAKAATEAAKGSGDKKKPAAAKAEASRGVLVNDKDYQEYDLYQSALKRPEKKGFGVQVGALSSEDALFRQVAELQGDWFDNILVNVEEGKKGEKTYKIILGPFKDEASAQAYKDSLKKKKKISGFVVALSPEATTDLYEIELKRPEKKGYGVQVGALGSEDAMLRRTAELQGKGHNNVLVSVEEGKKGETLYKIILGPFKDEAAAKSYKDSIKKKEKLDGFVVSLAPEAAAPKATVSKKKK